MTDKTFSQTHKNDHNADISKMDTIYRQAAIDALRADPMGGLNYESILGSLPSAQPTLYGYSIENLALIAALLAKENLPPERVSDALQDIGRVVAVIKQEHEEALRKAVEQCMI